MTKEHYLQKLETYLNPLSPEEKQDIITHFHEYLDETELSANDIIQELGQPDQLAKDILQSLYPNLDISLDQSIEPQPTENITVSSAVKAVTINLNELDINIWTAETEPITIDYAQQDNPYQPSLTYEVTNGHLTITEKPAELRYQSEKTTTVWQQFVKSSIRRHQSINLYLPQNMTLIDVTSNLGDVTICGTACEKLRLNSNCSDIHLSCAEVTTAHLFSMNGDIAISRSQLASGTIENQNGDIICQHITAQQTNLTNHNGDCDMTHCQLTDTQIILSNGDLVTENGLFNQIKVEVQNGDIDITDTEFANTVIVTNANGDTDITLKQALETLTIQVATQMGDIHLGETQESLSKQHFHQTVNNPQASLTIASQMGDIAIS